MNMPISLFEAYGIELEYMIVDRESLSVLPVTDRALSAFADGKIVSDIETGDIALSNELVLHVIELKCNGPARTLEGLAEKFQSRISEVSRVLEPMNARLMPTAAHPWMNPLTETRLWPHDYSPIYATYNRIFGCQGHGWSNLQSMHINLPFAGDEEFARLHAAIRLLLPVMPALTASSPLLDSRPTGFLDSRMEVYRHNADRIPSIAGQIIPEAVFDEAAYNEHIFQRIFRDIAPFDPDGTLRDEFLNSRGAIARFGRGTIEIRVLDLQECPQADLAVARLITAALKALVAEKWENTEAQKQRETGQLAGIFLDVIRDAEEAVTRDRDYLRAFGLSGEPVQAKELWAHLAQTCLSDTEKAELEPFLSCMSTQGSLARRILAALNGDFRHESLRSVYGSLCDCLEQGKIFAI